MKNKLKQAFSLIELSIVILVIGILIVGVVQGSTLISKMRITSATNLTKNSSVASINNLVLWYETTMAESFDSSVDLYGSQEETIAIWKDTNPQLQYKSNASQNTDDNKPFLTKNALHNLPAISFKGNDFFSTTLNQTFQGNLNLSFFIVFDSDHTSAVPHRLFSLHSGSSDYISLLLSSDQLILYSYNDGSFTSSPALLTSASDYGVKILYVEMNNNTLSSYANGQATQSDQAYDIGTFNFDELILGAVRTSPTTVNSFFSGQIGEIIFFNRKLKNSERQDIEDYLIQKWNIDR